MSRLAPEELERLSGQLPIRGELHKDAIELDTAAQFAAAIGTVLHADCDGRLVAPTTILTRLMITDRPTWYRELLRGTMFHAGERYLLHREIVVGDELAWTGTLESITSKHGRSGRLWFVQSHYEFRDAGDRGAVADAWRTRVVITD
jgi:N-terminal half of MaoC dehydratase